MATHRTLLCIHREPAQLGLLQDNGYHLLIATNGPEGLRLFMSHPIDAIVLEYHLGLLDGAVVAAEIKKLRPEVPIVMLTNDLELPDGDLKSVDAIVTKADGDHFLWATVHFVLNVKPSLGRGRQRRDERGKKKMRASLPATDRSGQRMARRQATTLRSHAGKATHFSAAQSPGD